MAHPMSEHTSAPEPTPPTGNASSPAAQPGNASNPAPPPPPAKPATAAEQGNRRWRSMNTDIDASTTDNEPRIAEGLARFERVLKEGGPLTRAELLEQADAAEWDPTLWARVLRLGAREDRIVYREGRYYPDYDTAKAQPLGRRGH